MNILILSGKFGMGHVSAGNALTEKINNIDSSINIYKLDLIEYLYPTASTYIYSGFKNLVNKHYEIYNLFYKAFENVQVDMGLPGNKIYKKVDDLMRLYNPSIVISTIPICAKTMSTYKKLTKSNIKLVTCITDISLHKEWVSAYTDVYLAPTKLVKNSLIESGVSEDNIYVTGVPVSDRFKLIDKEEIISSRKKILIMGGGLGLLPNMNSIMNTLTNFDNIDITIITGSNKKAFNKLKGKYKNTEVLGFVKNVNEYMKDSDLIITKAGGITLFESIHSNTPMFVIKPFLAQEKKNAEFIEEKEIGKVVWNEKDAEHELIDLILDNKKLSTMKFNMSELVNNMFENDINNVMIKICNECVA